MVVLLDLNMPGMNGVALLQAVMADAPLVMRHRFILFTAQDGRLPAVLVNLLREFSVPVLSKPCEIDAMLTLVAKMAASIP